MRTRVDFLIVGASLSGLVLAGELESSQYTYALIDAKDDSGDKFAYVSETESPNKISKISIYDGLDLLTEGELDFPLYAVSGEKNARRSALRNSPQTFVEGLEVTGVDFGRKCVYTAEEIDFYGRLVIGADGFSALTREIIEPKPQSAGMMAVCNVPRLDRFGDGAAVSFINRQKLFVVPFGTQSTVRMISDKNITAEEFAEHLLFLGVKAEDCVYRAIYEPLRKTRLNNFLVNVGQAAGEFLPLFSYNEAGYAKRAARLLVDVVDGRDLAKLSEFDALHAEVADRIGGINRMLSSLTLNNCLKLIKKYGDCAAKVFGACLRQPSDIKLAAKSVK